jgi:hypothetical protein
VQPCKPVGLQYSGAPQSAEALRLSNPQAPLRFTSRSHTAQRVRQQSHLLLLSGPDPRTRPVVAQVKGSRQPTWGTLRARRIAISSSYKYSSWERRASSAPLLRRIAIAARVWRREAIVIVFSCLSTMPTCTMLLLILLLLLRC